jgi:metal transporter CNNM
MLQQNTDNFREIIDESDVFIDVHKAIRRMAPAPRARVPRGKVITDIARKPSEAQAVDTETDSEPNGKPAPRKTSLPEMPEGHPKPSFLIRRRSSGSKAAGSPLRSDDPSVMEHLKHLGPSNVATRPKQTRINTVKIKPGQTNATPDIPKTIPEDAQAPTEATPTKGVITQDSHAPEGGVGEGLLASAGREASDGVHSVAVGYGTMAPSGDRMSWRSGRSGIREQEEEPTSPRGGANEDDENTHLLVDNRNDENGQPARGRARSVSTIASLRSMRSRSRSPLKKRHTARSGSISENIVDLNGIKKIVLETTSSSDSEEKANGSQVDGHDGEKHSEAESSHAGGKGASKKKRKKRGKKKKGGAGDSESQPLLRDR